MINVTQQAYFTSILEDGSKKEHITQLLLIKLYMQDSRGEIITIVEVQE